MANVTAKETPVRLKTTLLLTLLALAGVGCHTDQPSETNPEIAKNLRVVAEGSNKDLVFKADKPGTIIVNDFSHGGNLYSGHLNAGDVFTLLSNADHATVGKQIVRLEYDTNPVDTYRLYYLND